MIPKKPLITLLSVTLLILISLSCRVLAPEPTPTPVASTPTATPTPIPPTATPTPIPMSARLMGAWVADMDVPDTVTFTFNDGELTISFEDEIMVGRYTIDFAYEPAHLDLMFEDEGNVYTILEFVDEDTIRIDGNDSGETRPTSFGEDTLIFTRLTESD